MADLSGFDPNSVGNPNNNIFGLPFSESEARLVVLPVPWEVTVSYNAGTARAPDHIFKASLQVDLYDPDAVDTWKQGYFMRTPDQKILTRSDYLRKEAELYIHYISQGDAVCDNKFMMKTLKDINTGSEILNEWVYQQTMGLLKQNKLVALLGGDHSTPLGYLKACAEHYGAFSILQIDAHCDLRKAYEGFKYSHASVMYNALEEISQIERLVQVGIRDYCDEELEYIRDSNGRVYTLFDQDIKVQSYEGVTWKQMTDQVIEQLPKQVYVSFDIDGLDPKLCPQTGTPVAGGLEVEQTLYLIRRVIQSGRRIIGFDLNEVGVSQNEWDENVGARLLYRLCNLLLKSNP
ncbi:MAG: agmatinase family protein [Ferruginibacter sp.]|nr:agmatinase family protein [Ferruginibacter sp.]